MELSSSIRSKRDKAREEICTMLQQETSTYSNRFDYLAYAAREKNEKIHARFRRTICSWLFEVVDHFQYDREVAVYAIYYLDTAAAIRTKKQDKTIKRREYQLISVTSLYLAIKIHGGHHNTSRPDIQSFANLTNGKFRAKEIERTEIDMLIMMKWNVSPPSASRFVVNFIYFIPEYWGQGNPDELKSSKNEILSIFEVSRYLTELALHVSDISSNYNASEIAFASILRAMDDAKDNTYIPDWVREEFISNITKSTSLTITSVLPICSLLNEYFRSTPSCSEQDITTSHHKVHSPVSVRTYHTLEVQGDSSHQYRP